MLIQIQWNDSILTTLEIDDDTTKEEIHDAVVADVMSNVEYYQVDEEGYEVM